MIIVGANTRHRDGRTKYWFREESDIRSAKAVTKTNNEAIYCSNRGIVQNWFMLHDTSTDKSWSVYGIGLSKGDYITETTESFIRRIKQMALPSYNKADRRQNFEQLPKGAYVIQIIGAREESNKSGDGTHITIAFDIAEGDYKGFYKQQFDKNSNEDKKWPNDGTFYLTVPVDGCKPYIWTSWNSFFADLEDSNGGFMFGGDVKTLKGKLIGGKFHIEQSEYNGNVYDHTKLKWTCVADDVRQGKAGKLPADKLIESRGGAIGDRARRETDPFTGAASNADDFVSVPEGAEDEVPF